MKLKCLAEAFIRLGKHDIIKNDKMIIYIDISHRNIMFIQFTFTTAKISIFK